MARQLAAPGDDDCALKDSACPDCKASSCADFYEYNAKVQLTSWAGGCTCPRTTMRFLLFGQNGSIFIGNLGLFWIDFDRLIRNAYYAPLPAPAVSVRLYTTGL